jgi:hypothetical protein
MIKVYTGLKGFAVAFFFIVGLMLCLSIFFWGISKVIQLFLPLLIVLSYALIIVFLLGILPATFFKNLRPLLGGYSVLMSHALAASTGIVSFFFVVNALGFWGILVAFLFQFLAPIALVIAALKGAWPIAEHLTVWISFTYAMKFYSQWLLNVNSRNPEKRDIIDVDAIEVRNP